MTKSNKTLRREQLDIRLNGLAGIIPSRPRAGWINEIRTALLLTSKQLAQRLGVEQSTVTRLEQSEARSSITVESLERVAESLNCELRYVLLPRETLDDQVFKQARKVLQKESQMIEHTLSLEAQETGAVYGAEGDISIDTLLRTALLIQERGSRIWDDD